MALPALICDFLLCRVNFAKSHRFLLINRLVEGLVYRNRQFGWILNYEGLKYRDISQRTGLTISNVGFRLHQVLKKLAAGLMLVGLPAGLAGLASMSLGRR